MAGSQATLSGRPPPWVRKDPRRLPQPEALWLGPYHPGAAGGSISERVGGEGGRETYGRLVLTCGLQGKCDRSYLSDEDPDIWK